MEHKINQYNKLVKQLELLKIEKSKIDFNIKKLKEIIDEFETNHLDLIDMNKPTDFDDKIDMLDLHIIT